jgi:hypothetical protein
MSAKKKSEPAGVPAVDPRRQLKIKYLLGHFRTNATDSYKKAFADRLQEMSDDELRKLYESAREEQCRRDLEREQRHTSKKQAQKADL